MPNEAWLVIARTSDEDKAERMRSVLQDSGLETTVDKTLESVEIVVRARDEQVARGTLERAGFGIHELVKPGSSRKFNFWFRVVAALWLSTTSFSLVYAFSQSKLWGCVSVVLALLFYF